MRSTYVLGLSIGFLVGISFGYVIGDIMNSNSDGFAKCESMGGVYGGGKCFVNGFEVDNQ